MIDLNRISRTRLETEPYRWGAIEELFSSEDGAALAKTFPRDHFKRLADHVGEKKYEYEVRCLIPIGKPSVFRRERLSSAWRTLADDLGSPAYRTAMSSLTGVDLSGAHMEVNVFHYPPGGSHGAHPDHRDKIVTHVMYFNDSWNVEDGGCLLILRSSNPQHVAQTVSPMVGNSAVLVRSDDSWHAVSGVAKNSRFSRRSLTATFYHPGSAGIGWRSWDRFLLHDYPSRWQRLRRAVNGRTRATE